MALLRPSLGQLDQLTEPLNQSEAAIAQQLAKLDDGWSVFVQPRVSLDQPDFVAVHDLLGVCVIEVRDWSPGGSWPTSGDPRFSAARTRSVIYDQFFALPSDGTQTTATVRAAVILPRCTDAQAAELLGPASSDNGDDERKVEVWGADSLREQLGRIVQGTGCAHPRPESITRLRSNMVASEIAADRPVPIPRSGTAFEIEVNELAHGIRRVRGTAGSGKSFGLTARAAHLAAQGKRVLVLSFNVTLANRLRSMVTDRCAEYGTNATRVTCSNFHSLCTRIVQDAERLGVETSAPRGARWTSGIVTKATQALQSGTVTGYDAILLDEGQDFELAWWNLLRDHLLVPGGEMLLAADPTQDIYERTSWYDDASMNAAGFENPWLEMDGSYRLPADLVDATHDFLVEQASGGNIELVTPSDLADVAGPSHGSLRLWSTVNKVGEIGVSVGREVVRLLTQHPSLSPSDMAFICEYHHDGVAAVREIEAAGYEVHHIFSRNPDDARRRRKYRFAPDADAIKGSTIHSFKGWQTTALVVGIGLETKSKRMAYSAITRVTHHPMRPSVVSVISADKRLRDFGAAFAGTPVRPEGTTTSSPPSASPSPSPSPAPAVAAPVPEPAVQGHARATMTTITPSAPPMSPPEPAHIAAPEVADPEPIRVHEREPEPLSPLQLPSVAHIAPLTVKPLFDPTPNAPAISPGHASAAASVPTASPAPTTPIAPLAAPPTPAPLAAPAANTPPESWGDPTGPMS